MAHARQALIPFQLVDGEAEVFGAELAQGRSYLFGAECKASVFTWHGCTLEMSIYFHRVLSYNIYLAVRPPRYRSSIHRIYF